MAAVTRSLKSCHATVSRSGQEMQVHHEGQTDSLCPRVQHFTTQQVPQSPQRCGIPSSTGQGTVAPVATGTCLLKKLCCGHLPFLHTRCTEGQQRHSRHWRARSCKSVAHVCTHRRAFATVDRRPAGTRLPPPTRC